MNEITSLNFADLDVEELERRLEMAAAQPMAWICGADCPNLTCGVNVPCPNLGCGADCQVYGGCPRLTPPVR